MLAPTPAPAPSSAARNESAESAPGAGSGGREVQAVWEADARDAKNAPDYSAVRAVLESLAPTALHPKDSGLPDSLAAEVLAALERVRR